MKTMLSTIIAMSVASPALLADLSVGASSPTPQMPTQVQGNCDLLASNAVRATYLGQIALAVQSIDQEAPGTMQVAVFQVIDNIAYRRYVRYGDGPLEAGTKFSVSMSRELPGQPASIADEIALMQPGEEAVLKIDHLYIFGEQEGRAIRPCTRMARAQAPTATPKPAPTPAQPGSATVPPMPQQPAAPQPVLPAAPRPMPQLPADASDDDTIVEQAPIITQPVQPAPGVKGGAAPATQEEGF